MSSFPVVLMLNIAGLPVRWLGWRRAAVAYHRGNVRWEAGASSYTLRAGTRDGVERSIVVNSIIAVDDQSRGFGITPRLTNERLFQRDGWTCLYCGANGPRVHLTRDHVVPRARLGPDTWLNTVTACSSCNSRKGCRTPEEAGMPLLAIPYAPTTAEQLLLSNRQILADQMEFLGRFKRKERAPH